MYDELVIRCRDNGMKLCGHMQTDFWDAADAIHTLSHHADDWEKIADGWRKRCKEAAQLLVELLCKYRGEKKYDMDVRKGVEEVSILIRGMKMPKTCHCCRMCVQVSDGDIDWHWECCLLCEEVARYATDRIPGCPLVHVPEHGRCVDADELKTAFPCGESVRTECVRATIDHAPTIIPAEEGE